MGGNIQLTIEKLDHISIIKVISDKDIVIVGNCGEAKENGKIICDSQSLSSPDDLPDFVGALVRKFWKEK